MSARRSVPPVLIVSTGRTGTRYLAHLLAQHYPNVAAHHTTPWSTLINIIGNAHIAGLLPKNVLLGVWQALKGKEFAHTNKDLFVDSNNHLYVFARYAASLYPGVRIVHVVRDPRTYVRSHLNWARQRTKSFVANHLLPFWQPNAWLLKEMSAGRWLRMSRFEQFCWIWDFKNRFLAALANCDVPYLCLRLEDIIHPLRHRESINALATFMGLTPLELTVQSSTERLNSTDGGPIAPWQHWSLRRCLQLNAICARQMHSYGYGLEPEWRQKLRLGDRIQSEI